MKKLLSALGAVLIVSSATTSVIACDDEGGVMHDLTKVSIPANSKYAQIVLVDDKDTMKMVEIYSNLTSLLNSYLHQADKGGISPFTDVNVHVFDHNGNAQTNSDFGKEYVDGNKATNKKQIINGAVTMRDNYKDNKREFTVSFVANPKSSRAKNKIENIVMHSVKTVDLSKIESGNLPSDMSIDTGKSYTDLDALSHDLVAQFAAKMGSKINLADDNAVKTSDGKISYVHSDFAMTSFYKIKAGTERDPKAGDAITDLKTLQSMKGQKILIHFNAASKAAVLISNSTLDIICTVK